MTASTIRFWDKIADRYSKKPVPDQVVYEKKLELTRQYLNINSKVFEFGCGTGTTALLHAPYVKSIIATDFSPEMISIAEQKQSKQNMANVTFKCTSIEAFQTNEHEFDVILGMSILHLLKDKAAVVKKVHHMLKPGGVFVTSTACIADFFKAFRLIEPIGRRLGFFPLVKVFSAEDLKHCLINAGFTIDFEWQPGKKQGIFIIARKI